MTVVQELTVGYVAGIIALGLVIVQILLPTVVSFLLAGTLRDNETAATWTVASRVIQSSYWPTILRSDATKSHGVRWPILLTSAAIPSLAMLGAVTGVVTPLGLYEEFETQRGEAGNFQYIQDTSAFLDGTSPRGVAVPSRFCRLDEPLHPPGPCPYTNDTVLVSRNSTTTSFNYPNGTTSGTPPILRDIFSSGTKGIRTTVSNFFDIEWRELTTQSDKDIDDGKPYSIGMYRQIDSSLLWDNAVVIEGLVVDARSGGIGFRNHTAPVGFSRNVSWHEDLLFVEPATTCVDTNLTFDYTMSTTYDSSDSSGLVDYRLTDRGGFINLNHTAPSFDDTDPQANPDLWGRAYYAGMFNNFFTMLYLNVTNPANRTLGIKSFEYLNSTLDQSFPLGVESSRTSRGLGITSQYGHYLFGSSSKGPKYPNPYNVTLSGWFDDARDACAGARAGDIANISNIYVACGLMRGVAKRMDPGPKGIAEHNSKWSAPVYSCATALRATIKTVHFTHTGSGATLKSIQVDSITDKAYSSPSEYPYWGVEESGMALGQMRPTWGLVSPGYEKFPNVSVIRQPSLYLPGHSDTGIFEGAGAFGPSISYLGQSYAGADFPVSAAETIYSSSTISGISDSSWSFDMLGHSNMAVFMRWQNLSGTASEASKIINLLWTDLAASAVVGTKGVLGTNNAGAAEDDTAVVYVNPSLRVIKYRYAFAIPALILLLIVVLATSAALFFWILNLSSIGRLKLRVQQLASGRIFTVTLYPESSNFFMHPSEWSALNGSKTVSLVATRDTVNVKGEVVGGQELGILTSRDDKGLYPS
ncbi:hypothetical protein B0H67DRAFT_645739 [Lasiosphaeris hirsuta]|uniref:Uncharacterized protein n=1 Tax=Lasiosphaeris hirsuta TaxID=260670 RepID=A0AA40AHR2_9PEZI|nr:hypothetical protein B0H67DRAFT_645739 [Lasiosphaeris hirsuta]